MSIQKLYLAGGLFNAGERLHNLFLEKHLRQLGYDVILPQREALKHFDGSVFDTSGIVAECQMQSSSKENIYVGSIDGSDADSGTCVEYGFAISSTGRAIVYRTDFRTEQEKEVGLNAMLNASGTIQIYRPCFFVELGEVDQFYRELAGAIDAGIRQLAAS